MTKETFNPYEHLSVYHDADGNPLFENLEENGKPVCQKGDDGKYHSVLIPKRFINSNGYREWFRCRYPNGCIDIEDMTQDAVSNGSTFIDSLEYKVKVTLYEDREKKLQIANSYGIIRKTYKPDSKTGSFAPEYSDNKNTFELAQSIGLRNAMLNAGFIYDTSDSVLREKDSQYLNIIVSGPVLDFAPANEKTKAVSVEEQTPANDILNYISGMNKQEEKTATIDEKLEISSTNVVENDNNYDPKQVVFEALEEASERLKGLNGKFIGELDAGMIAYLSSGNWKGKLSPETIKAIETLA